MCFQCCELPHPTLPPKVDSNEAYTPHLFLKFYTELLVFLRVTLTSLEIQALVKEGNHIIERKRKPHETNRALRAGSTQLCPWVMMGTVGIIKCKTGSTPLLRTV